MYTLCRDIVVEPVKTYVHENEYPFYFLFFSPSNIRSRVYDGPRGRRGSGFIVVNFVPGNFDFYCVGFPFSCLGRFCTLKRGGENS